MTPLHFIQPSTKISDDNTSNVLASRWCFVMEEFEQWFKRVYTWNTAFEYYIGVDQNGHNSFEQALERCVEGVSMKNGVLQVDLVFKANIITDAVLLLNTHQQIESKKHINPHNDYLGRFCINSIVVKDSSDKSSMVLRLCGISNGGWYKDGVPRVFEVNPNHPHSGISVFSLSNTDSNNNHTPQEFTHRSRKQLPQGVYAISIDHYSDVNLIMNNFVGMPPNSTFLYLTNVTIQSFKGFPLLSNQCIFVGCVTNTTNFSDVPVQEELKKDKTRKLFVVSDESFCLTGVGGLIIDEQHSKMCDPYELSFKLDELCYLGIEVSPNTKSVNPKQMFDQSYGGYKIKSIE